ncbi:uncharacterized protein LOC111636727 isoform X3 [Centruroides sculpturatus]|uniref:uncharacterized protein LOC111636727 isoform X3 n=1 Tax=Centruroides sculpturatus TaxID=218467 RepID=UPI000C6E298C|nr:uncharacterized protein LOC111636727 isoform X3 [Centruroides sculpturatus]
MFMTESRRKFSRQKETTKEISSHRTYSHLASASIPRESLKEGENVESSVPAPFIVGFYRPDNSLMAYKGQRSKQVKLSQSIQNGNSPLRSDSYMKESSTSADRMIHNNVNSYSTRHLHAIKPSGPSKFRTCSRTTEDINKDVHSTIQHSPGPVLSQALKLEKFRTPDFGNVHSVTRTHAWVEQQTISEKSNEHDLKNIVSGNTNIKMEYNKVNTISKQPEINRKIPHQLHENLDHSNTLRHRRIEKQNLCAHFSPKRDDDNVESESLRNACAKWFARDDVTSIHRHIPNKGTYVDLSLNIKSSEEPDKVVQKETIGRTHQETSKRRHLDEDEDKSSSESGRGTMQSGMTGPKHHLDISLDSDHSVVTWIKKESIPCNQTSQLDSVPHDSTQSSSMKPKTVSSPQESSNSERKDRQKSQPVRNRCQTGLKSTITRNSHQNKIFLNDTESNTTTSIDLESLTLEDDDDDVSASNYHEDNEMFVIRQQLDGLETMYSEILRLLGVKSRCLKMGSRISSRPEHHHRSGRSRKIYGSLSSLTGKSCSTHREKSHCHNEKRRCKESKNGSSNRCIQRLECHVVNLARNIARLSSEIRSQQYLSRELDELRNDVTWVRDQLKLVQSSTSKNFKDWDTFRTEVLQILNPGRIRKLTKFFGAEPPLLRQFLKRLGYEKYAPNFETEKIGIMELPYLNEEKLQKLGIPMGPRIRILQEAHFTFHQNDLKIYIV